MPKFEYLIVEKLIKTVVVEADDEEQADEIMGMADCEDGGNLWDMGNAEIERYYELWGEGSKFEPNYTKDILNEG